MNRYLSPAVIIAALLISISCSDVVTAPESLNVIPMPNSMEIHDGAFPVAGADVRYSPEVDAKSIQNITGFAERLTTVTGKKSRVSQGSSGKGINFIIDATPAEGYNIEVTERKVTVRASDSSGFLYAIQTLSQMLPVEFFGTGRAPGVNWALRCVSISDSPRFPYRGMHLDVCRHYFPVSEIKRYLDVMALHKMNRFHWHLTEDQGWRVEIKKYPKLTELGSKRKGTMVGKDWGSDDGIEYGGYYTQDEVKEIVRYADNLGITVIPEIDLPGHMMGALHAYPELGCTGGPYEVWTQWGVSDQVLCPGKEGTFIFLEDVLTEIMDMFPSEYIHIGGDECPKVAWRDCPDCQERIRELGIKGDKNHSAETLLQNYVTSRIQDFMNIHGRKIIGWDEILEGELAEGATIMSWRGVEGGIEAAKKGFDAIMTPSTYAYFDYCQSEIPELEPLSIGGYVPLEKVYGYEPFDGIPEEARKHILGVQANVWTEYISKPEHLEYMVLPRMDALSEVQWCNPEIKDMERLKSSIMDNVGRIYDTMGFTWCKVAFGEYGLPGIPGGTN